MTMIGFSADDAHLIQLASWHPSWRYMTEPEIYQLLSVAHFTPLVPLLYQFILFVAGMSPMAFFSAQLLLLAATMLGSVALIRRLSSLERGEAALPQAALFFGVGLYLLALLANQSLYTLLLRSYTLHYLMGGALTVWSLYLLLPDRGGHRQSQWHVFLGGVLLFLAFASKEIYWPVLGVCLVWAIRYRCNVLAVVPLLALGLTLGWQGYLLGFSAEGRQGAGLLTGLSQVSWQQWQSFGGWYLSQHWGLMVLSGAALLLIPSLFMKLISLAVLLLAPVLAAPHGFTMPEMNADRLLYPFHMALGLVLFKIGVAQSARLVLCQGRTHFTCTPSHAGAIYCWMLAGLLFVMIRLWLLPPVFPKAESLERMQTRALLDLLDKDDATVIGVPPYFRLGGLMSGFRAFEGRAIRITPNCLELLAQPADGLAVLADANKPLSYETGEGHRSAGLDTCRVLAMPEGVQSPIRVHQTIVFQADGRLRWQLSWNPQFFSAEAERLADQPALEGGVYFPERGLMIPIMYFNERLARPRDKESYQWFVRQGDAWWFSKSQIIQFFGQEVR